MSNLEQEIILRAKAGPLIVVVDDAHNIPLPDSGGMDRRGLNIEIANRLKTLVSVWKIPLLATIEARKKGQGADDSKRPTKHDLMETGKWSYNSDIIWMLHSTGQVLSTGQIELNLFYDANKLSSCKETKTLWLTPSIAKIEMGVEE